MAAGRPLPPPHLEDVELPHTFTFGSLSFPKIQPSNSSIKMIGQPPALVPISSLQDPSPMSNGNTQHKVGNQSLSTTRISSYADMVKGKSDSGSRGSRFNSTPKSPSPYPHKPSYAAILTGLPNKNLEDSNPAFPKKSDIDGVCNGRVNLKPTTTYLGKPAVIFSNSDKLSLIKRMKYVLIAKFSHGRPSLAAVKEFFAHFNLTALCNISVYDSKHLILECEAFYDYVKLWLSKHCLVGGYPMRLFKWREDFNTSVESPICPVWVHLPGLPLYLYEEATLMSIANAIGRPLALDLDNINRSKLGCASFCVEVDVSLEVIDKIWISFDIKGSGLGRQGVWQKVIYDLFPSYCKRCAHLGHSIELCLRMDNLECNVVIGDIVEGKKLVNGEGGTDQSGLTGVSGEPSVAAGEPSAGGNLNSKDMEKGIKQVHNMLARKHLCCSEDNDKVVVLDYLEGACFTPLHSSPDREPAEGVIDKKGETEHGRLEGEIMEEAWADGGAVVEDAQGTNLELEDAQGNNFQLSCNSEHSNGSIIRPYQTVADFWKTEETQHLEATLSNKEPGQDQPDPQIAGGGQELMAATVDKENKAMEDQKVHLQQANGGSNIGQQAVGKEQSIGTGGVYRSAHMLMQTEGEADSRTVGQKHEDASPVTTAAVRAHADLKGTAAEADGFVSAVAVGVEGTVLQRFQVMLDASDGHKASITPPKLSSAAAEFTPKWAILVEELVEDKKQSDPVLVEEEEDAGGQVVITKNVMEQLKERMNRLRGDSFPTAPSLATSTWVPPNMSKHLARELKRIRKQHRINQNWQDIEGYSDEESEEGDLEEKAGSRVLNGNAFLSDEMGDIPRPFKIKSAPNSPKGKNSSYDSSTYLLSRGLF